ncbi:MAG: hypothetical protein SGCHY_000398 [Lobulomycetales sp.]
MTCDLRDSRVVERSFSAINSQTYKLFDLLVVGLADIRSQRSNSPEPSDETSSHNYIIVDNQMDIFERRNAALKKILANEQSRDYILFLDHCEELATPNTIALLVESWTRLSYFPTPPAYTDASFRQPVHYLHLQSQLIERNPYDVLESLSLLGSPTSMFTTWEAWKAFKPLKKAQGYTLTQNFWIACSLSSFYGIGIRYNILVNQDSDHIKASEAGLSDPETAKAPATRLPGLEAAIASLKREWRPCISVIIPYFNIPSALWFNQTLSSLTAQTFHDFEVVIVNDGTSKLHHSLGPLSRLQSQLVDGKLFVHGSSRQIPMTVIHHSVNLGLAEARNTGVKTARGNYVIFLDPDDRLDKTALEKLALFAMPIVGNPVPHRARGEKFGFVYSGTVHFGDKDDIVYSSYSPERLLRENYITATSLVSREIYLQVGGMCPRTLVRYFEDYDFWLRMSSLVCVRALALCILTTTQGYQGKMLREPLFWYRRHDAGQSTRILKSSGGNFAQEVRENNPVAFGDMRLKKAREYLGSLDSSNDENKILPCYRRMQPVNDYVARLYHIVTETESMNLHHSDSRAIPTEHGSEKVVFASEYLANRNASISMHNPSCCTRGKLSVVVFIPWMVMGGADLYDVSMLQGLRNSKQYHITIIVERSIPRQEWQWRYEHVADEIFNLQTLSNSSTRQDEIVDYIVRSRSVSLAINSRTVAGYRAFERWNNTTHIKLLDILHLYHFKDRSNWEWRSGRIGKYLTSRVVVSQDLADFMIDVVRGGDLELGVAEHTNDDYFWSSLEQDEHGRFTSNTTRPSLMESERSKFNVIYPPIVMPMNLTAFPNNSHAWWNDSCEKPSAHDIERRPTVFFLGRFDSQKDPIFWLKVVKAFYEEHYTDFPPGVDPRFVMLGQGHLAPLISRTLQSEEFARIRPFIVGYPLSHEEVAVELGKHTNAVLLMTSRFEGLPISLLEATALGIPTVSLKCGGFHEVLQDPSIWTKPLAQHEGRNVRRGNLASIIGYQCEGPIEQVPVSRPDNLAKFMAQEVRFWLMENSGKSWKEQVKLRRSRWESATRFRGALGVYAFQKRWLDLLGKSLGRKGVPDGRVDGE